jgi:hypothetical protein
MSDLNCIIHLMGGLGNQMFQYALGRRLQIQRGARVRFDLSMYKVKSERALTIPQYRVNLPGLSAGDHITTRLSFGRTLGKAAAVLKPLREQLLWKTYEDMQKGFDPHVAEMTGRWYLRGWWQTPLYFQDIRELLIEEFVPRLPLSQSDAEMLRRIENCNAVSLHVRRGDLVRNPIFITRGKVQSAEYYSMVLQDVTAQLSNPHVFVFSDDPAWSRQNIRSDVPITFMDKHDGQTDYIDLHLMTRCRHFITANSTFSWWAAWLSESRDKIVVVPPVWGTDGSGLPPELIPADWQVGPLLDSPEHAQAAGMVR